MKKVYCIGELLIDFIAENQGNDLSKADVFTKKAGGAPANVACAIAKLGGLSKFIGCVGPGPFGSFLLGILEDNHVDTSLSLRSKSFTTIAFVSIAEDGERDFVFSRGADKKLKYDSSIKNSFQDNIIHFGSATALLGGDLEAAYGQYFLDALAQKSFICFDPNFRTDLWKTKEATFIEKCMPFVQESHLCKFSLEEAQLISGKTDLEECCDVLHKIGTKTIVITLGGAGTLLSTENSKHKIPSIPVTPVDTTGAGDAFIGCLLYQISLLHDPMKILADTDLLIDMVKTANIAGALTTTSFGAIPSLPNQEQLQAIK